MLGDYLGSRRKAIFQCWYGHSWAARPDSVMDGNGCPMCRDLPKITEVDVTARIASRGLVLVSDYSGMNNKALFRCQDGHEWRSVVSSVARGCGCPTCARKTKGPDIRPFDVVAAKFSERGFLIIGRYVKMSVRVLTRCSHGHEWAALPSSVFAGTGCPSCAQQNKSDTFRLSSAELTNRLVERGYEILGPYVNGRTKARFRCSEGHVWTAHPDNVLRVSGCPYCAQYGFNRARNASFYVLKVCGPTGDFTGYGITHSTASRLVVHRRNLAAHGYRIIDQFVISGEGDAIFTLEQEVKREFAVKAQQVEGFVREATHVSEYENLVRFARSFIRSCQAA